MDRKYVIMAGGDYSSKGFDGPKALTVVGGETIIKRTLRLLANAGIDALDICITGSDPRLDSYGVEVLRHDNNYISRPGGDAGYWVDAFYPHFDDDAKVTYLYGDAVYSQNAINMVVHNQRPGNILFGTGLAKNRQHKEWGEPFAYQVDDYRAFMDAVNALKHLYDEGKTKRQPITWEVYRYLNGLDANVMAIKDETYICIDDGTIDIDAPSKIEKAEENMRKWKE